MDAERRVLSLRNPELVFFSERQMAKIIERACRVRCAYASVGKLIAVETRILEQVSNLLGPTSTIAHELLIDRSGFNVRPQ